MDIVILFIFIFLGSLLLTWGMLKGFDFAERFGKRSCRLSFGKHYELGKLLTRNEYSFYMQIRKMIPNELLILPKVRMEDFLEVIARDKYRYRGYVRCRHIDFLICTPTLNIVCGIELDDSSHFTKEAQRSDKLKNDVFKEIKVPLFRCFNNKKDVNRIADEIVNAYERSYKK